jgi:putative salt-induced outer membrane protein
MRERNNRNIRDGVRAENTISCTASVTIPLPSGLSNAPVELSMIRRGIPTAALVLIVAASVVFSDDAPPPPPPAQGWSGKGQAGYVMSRGNSDTDSANAKVDLADVIGEWKHSIHLEGLYARSDEITSAERWAAMIQSDLQITPRVFGFGALHFVQDEFSGFQYQASATTGIGYHFIDTAADKLNAQAGVGYRRLRPELLTMDAAGAVIARTPGESTGAVIGTAGFDYAHLFNASTKITNKLLVESGMGNTSLENDLALVVSMSKTLAISVGFTFLENTQPPVGLKKVNTLTTLNLTYAFTP